MDKLEEVTSLVRIGLIGDLKVKLKLLELGFNVFSNVCDDGGVDMVIEFKNKYKKIQVKRATRLTKNKLSFRLGNTNKKSDFVICNYNEDYWVIPDMIIKNNAFQLYPNPQRKNMYHKYKNNWQILLI